MSELAYKTRAIYKIARRCEMKRIIGSLLGLLMLAGLAVALALTFSGLQRGAQPASQAFQSPFEKPTPLFYSPHLKLSPPPITIIPPTVTRAPKPSPIPTPTPTETPIPTPLPLPPSAFYALWAENFPEGQGSALWLADPRDIGSRREVLRFDQDSIYEAALSPNGRRIALVSGFWKTFTLWVVNIDGSDLQQIEQGSGVGGPLLWSRDSRLLTYGISWREEIMMPSYKDGTPGPMTVWRGATILLDMATGEKKELEDIGSPLGWSPDGQELYYSLSVPQEAGYSYELWAIDKFGRRARKIAQIGTEPVPLILSPDGTKFLIRTAEGNVIISADGRKRKDIPLPPWELRCGFIWSPRPEEAILCRMDEKSPIEYIEILNLESGAIKGLATVEIPADGVYLGPIDISPDMEWMVASVYQGRMYWVHLPTRLIVPVPRPEEGSVFHIAWVKKPIK